MDGRREERGRIRDLASLDFGAFIDLSLFMAWREHIGRYNIDRLSVNVSSDRAMLKNEREREQCLDVNLIPAIASCVLHQVSVADTLLQSR